jgi:hypothetical protein
MALAASSIASSPVKDDYPQALGPYTEGLQLLSSGALQRHGWMTPKALGFRVRHGVAANRRIARRAHFATGVHYECAT